MSSKSTSAVVCPMSIGPGIPILEKTVAIKIMTADAASDPESRSRFLREARLAAGLANVGSSALASVKSFSIGDSPYGVSDFAVSKTSHSRSNNF